jgi:hypothetical protein
MINKNVFSKKLASIGLGEVIDIGRAAAALGMSSRCLRENITLGRLRKADRGSVTRDDLAKWLATWPRYATKMK